MAALRLTAKLVYFGLTLVERIVDWRDARKKEKREAAAKAAAEAKR